MMKSVLKLGPGNRLREGDSVLLKVSRFGVPKVDFFYSKNKKVGRIDAMRLTVDFDLVS